MKNEAAFWNNIAAKYAQQPIADEASYQKKLAQTQALFKPDMEVLELGCGTGTTAITHAPFVRHIQAVDISSAMLEIGKTKAAAKGISNITFQCAAIDTLHIPDTSVDMVMCHSILHLLDDKEAVIANIYRMLKPGGYFVSSTACLSGVMGVLRVVIPVMACFGKAPKTVRFFSPAQLNTSIQNAGFVVEDQWQPGKTGAVFIIARKA